jgi:AmiR/NasT family two-component response regulator
MKRAALDEPTAFRRLQKLSSDRNVKIAELARTIVEGDEAMQP